MSCNIPNEYNQQPGEDFSSWKFRLMIGKAKKQISLTWQQIVELLGLSCSKDYLRKLAYGILEYVEFSEAQQIEIYSPEILEEIEKLEQKKMEFEKEKIKMQDQKRMLRKDLREWARAEQIKEDLQKSIQNIANTKPLNIKTKIPNDYTREGALLLSDWHIGNNVSTYWNIFNSAELRKRIQKLTKKSIIYGH